MRSIIKSDGNKSICIMEFDLKNTHEQYEYMAKGVDNGKYIVGNVVVRKPWYSCKDSWTYYIYRNKYDGAGLNGGVAIDGLERVEVDRNTIEPLTQLSYIKLEHEQGRDVILVKDYNKKDSKENIICRINVGERIPIELWEIENAST